MASPHPPTVRAEWQCRRRFSGRSQSFTFQERVRYLIGGQPERRGGAARKLAQELSLV
jgi:hypothetical protein